MAYLPLDRQREIDGIITDISLRDVDDDYYYPPVDVQEITKSRGIELILGDLSMLPGKPSGMITYEDSETKSGPKILIEEKMGSARRRFTLAHELGHHFLHGMPEGVKYRLETLDYSKQSTKDETEANYFAASLLIPADFLQKLRELGKTVDELAYSFQVSPQAIRNRINWVEAN